MFERDASSADLVLDRYWDEVLAGNSEGSAGEINPALAATVRRVHALDAMATTRPHFASQLWEELVHTQADILSAPTRLSSSPRTLFEPVSALQHHRFGARAMPSLSRLAAAVIVFALIAASAIAALYPLGILDRDAPTIFAPAFTPPTDAQGVVGKALLSLTLTDLPPMRSFGGMTVTDYPLGASTQERTGVAPQVLFVPLGSLTMTVLDASEPVRIIAAGQSEPTAEDALLGSGNEADLPTGSTVITPPGSVIELFNAGPDPARMLVLLDAHGGDSNGTQRDGATWRWGSVGMPQEIAPPVHIDLRQVTVNPSAALPIPPSEMADYSAAVLDGQRVRDLSFAADLGWRNTSFAPLDAYLLQITSGSPRRE